MKETRVFRLALWIGAVAYVIVGLTNIAVLRVFVEVGLGRPPVMGGGTHVLHARTSNPVDAE